MYTKNTFVSIIINNYNYCEFLKDAIDSSLSQTYSLLEVIVVDDGSTDNSKKIIAGYGNKIKPVFKKNGGQASALNKGFKESKGDLIIFLDADDALLPSAVEKVVESFSEEDIVKIHWPLKKINKVGMPTGYVFPQANLMAVGDLIEDLIEKGPDHLGSLPKSPPTSGNAWSNKFLKQVMPLSEKDFWFGGNDYFLSALSPLFGKIKVIQEPLSLYRVHGSNDTLKPIEEYVIGYFNWFNYTNLKAKSWLDVLGFSVNDDQWMLDSWYHRLDSVLKNIADLIPVGCKFILVDEGSIINSKTINQRKRIPFTEVNGIYNGHPVNDEAAICEIKKQVLNGVSHICFLWPAYWYFDFFPKMMDYLKSHYACKISNSELVLFEYHKKLPINSLTQG